MRLQPIPAIFLLVLLTACSKKNALDTPAPLTLDASISRNWVLAAYDEFDAPEPDTAFWFYRAPGTRGNGYNHPSVVYMNNAGQLVMRMYSDTIGSQIRHYSGMLASRSEYLYGRFDCRMRANNQPGSWSAFWLQSPTIGAIPDDPGQSGTEIDVVELLPADCKARHAIHWNGYGANHKKNFFVPRNCNISPGAWHVYSLEWTPDHYRFFVDGTLSWETKTAISNRSEFLVMSTEIWELSGWAGKIPPGGYGSAASSTNIAEFDYVRYYRYQ